jgi:transposase-like protein
MCVEQHGTGDSARPRVSIGMAMAEIAPWHCAACASAWPRRSSHPGAARRARRRGHGGARIVALRGVRIGMAMAERVSWHCAVCTSSWSYLSTRSTMRGVRVVMATAERVSWRCMGCASSLPWLSAHPGAARRPCRHVHDEARLLSLSAHRHGHGGSSYTRTARFPPSGCTAQVDSDTKLHRAYSTAASASALALRMNP